MTYETIADSLSVGKAKLTEWLSRTVKEKKDRRDGKIFDMWMACHTQEEIAAACSAPQETVRNIVGTFSQTVLENQTAKAAASHATDFDPPIYNVWKQQEKETGENSPQSTRDINKETKIRKTFIAITAAAPGVRLKPAKAKRKSK